MINEFDTIMISEVAEYCGADSSHAEGKAKEETGDSTHLTRNKFLRKHEDGREGRSEDEPNNKGEDAGPCQIRIGQGQSERCSAQDRYPDYELSADTVADGSAKKSAYCNSKQEREKMHLRRLHRQVEAVHQVKNIIAAQTGQIKKLRKHQNQQN